MQMANPFADFGTPVEGDRFIGREEELRLIHGRLFGSGGFGSLGVVGLPRIGKTSLVLEAVARERARLTALRAIVIRLNVGACGSVDQLFREMISDLGQGLDHEGLINERLKSCIDRVLVESPITFPTVRAVFREARQLGVRPICILDEFDAGRYAFVGTPQVFHWFRELCSNPEFKAAMVLVSKRSLEEVSRIAGHDSDYWANVLMTVTLRPFSSEETKIFYERAHSVGVRADPEISQEVSAVCGRHPYLLEAFAYYGWEQVARGMKPSVEWFRREMRSVIRDYYHQIVTILRDASVLNKYVQAMVGPRWDLTPDDVDDMLRSGLLSTDGSRHLKSFSEGFEDYVRFVEGTSEIWPLWRETERTLRSAVDELLCHRFGSPWVDGLKKARPKLRDLLEEREQLMAKEVDRFGARAASSLLAYTYPMELYQIAAADWPALGQPLFGSDRQAWSVKFGILSRVRTPLAHNRDEGLEEGERIQAEGICREILGRIASWRKASSQP